MPVTKRKYNGLDAIVLDDGTSEVIVTVYAAHVVSWSTAAGEQLFVSSAAEYGGGKAVRGGIPICWPQFAARGPGGKHGFCRNSAKWTVVRTSEAPFPCVVFGLADDEATKADYPHSFSLRYSVTLDGPNSVSTAMQVQNTGEAPLEFTGALHTYFKVGDASGVKFQGLQGVTYEDSAAGGTAGVQEEAHLGVAGELDRIYFKTPPTLYIIDEKGGRAIKLLKMGWPDAVAWNIGEGKAGGLKDLGAGEWKKYVCLEAALIGKPYALAPSTSYCAGQTFTAGAALPDAKKKKKKGAKVEDIS